MRVEKYDERIKEYDLAIESCLKTGNNGMSTIYQNRAAAYDRWQVWSLVIDECSTALAFDPRYLKALKRRAKAYELQRELAKSLEDIMAACILEEFQNKSTLVLANRVLNVLGQQYVEKGLKERHDVQPSSLFVKLYCAEKSIGFTKKLDLADQPKENVKPGYEGIIEASTKTIQKNDRNKMIALLTRATCYLMTARYVETSADLDAIIGSNLADKELRANALIMRAKVSMKTQPSAPEEWFQFFSRAEMIDPQNGDIYYHRGLAYMEIERVSEAINDFEKACSLNRSNSIFQIHRCGAIYRQALINKDEDARHKVMNGFLSVIKQKKICIDSYIIMAEALYDRRTFQQTNNLYGKATKLDPEFAQRIGYHMLVPFCQFMCHKVYIMHALRVDDSCPFAYEALGMVQVQQGQLEGAIVLFESAIKMAKTEAELARLCKLKNAVVAQLNATKNMGLDANARILDFYMADIFIEM